MDMRRELCGWCAALAMGAMSPAAATGQAQEAATAEVTAHAKGLAVGAFDPAEPAAQTAEEAGLGLKPHPQIAVRLTWPAVVAQPVVQPVFSAFER